MAHTRRPQHPNAALTPAARLKMVRLVVDDGWCVAAVAQRFQVDPKTVRKWCCRYRAEGCGGLEDRSSRPRRTPLDVSLNQAAQREQGAHPDDMAAQWIADNRELSDEWLAAARAAS